MSATATATEAPKLGRQARQLMVRGLTQTVSGATGVFVCNVQKLPVTEVETLRRSLSAVAAELTFVKNSLGKRALGEAGLGSLDSYLEGTSVVGVTQADPVAVSKVLVTFAKEHEGFTVRGAVVEGQPLPAAAIKQLAALPSREVLIAKILGSMQAPIRGLVGVLSGVTRTFVYVVEAIRKSKEEAT